MSLEAPRFSVVAWDEPHGVVRLDHAAVSARIASACLWLESLAGEDDRVAFIPRPDVSSLALLAACFARGNPVVVLHPRSTDAERVALLSRLGGAVVMPALPMFEAGPSPRAFDEKDDERPLVIVPTSGTTGQPKGVVLSARAFKASFDASRQRAPFLRDDVALLSLPLAHVGGLSLFVRALMTGATLALPPAGPYQPAEIASLIDRLGVTQLSLVPTMLARHLAESALPSRGTLRRVLVGGAPASSALLTRALAAGLPVRATYGLSEACSQVATQATPDDGGVGAPLPTVEARIEHGAIALRGPTLFSGYLEHGIVRTALDEDGYFVTGDLGHIDANGMLHVLGRGTDMIITGGENVMPAEVEAALLAIDGVREAVVVGCPDAQWGERVVACIVLDEAACALTADAMREALSLSLARYKVPAEFRIVPSLPLLPSGKVDRQAVARAQR